jgi:uncharacterized membrane protein YkoI
METRAVALIILLLCTAANAAPGGAGTPPAVQGRAVLRNDALSMDQAVKMVEERFRARVVKAETQTDEGHTVYVLRLLDESGKVWTVRVDAESGSVQ